MVQREDVGKREVNKGLTKQRDMKKDKTEIKTGSRGDTAE